MEHAGDPKTNGVNVTQDILRLKHMFYLAPAHHELTSIVDPMSNIEVEEGVEVEEGANEDSDNSEDSDDDTVTVLTANCPHQSVHVNHGLPPAHYCDEAWSVARNLSRTT
jgi:hypothetical protein